MSSKLTRLAVVALIVVVATTASATTTRINSLGGGVKGLTVMDDQNIFQLPSEVTRWGNVAVLELGGDSYYDDDFTSFLFTYDINESMVFGFYGSNAQMPASGLLSDVVPSADNYGITGNNHRATLLFGMDMESLRLGARLGIYAQSNKDDYEDSDGSETEEWGPSVLDLGAGLGLPMGDGSLDVGVNFVSGSSTHEYDPDDTVNPDGNEISETMFGVVARMTMPMGEADETLIPFASFDAASATWEHDDVDIEKQEATGARFMAGVDLNIPLGENSFIQPGLGFAAFSVKYEPGLYGETQVDEETYSTLQMPFFNVAAEIQVWNWLDFRFGGAQYVNFDKSEYTGDDGEGSANLESTRSNVSHTLTTGLGVNLPGDVAIDIQVEKDWWRHGPYLLTGNSNTFGLSAAITKDW